MMHKPQMISLKLQELEQLDVWLVEVVNRRLKNQVYQSN
jgi:hypothetical protein